MTDFSNDSDNSNTPTRTRNCGPGQRRNRKRGLMALLVVGGVIGGIALVGSALAHPGFSGRGPANVKDAKARASRVIDRIADRLDASDAQVAALNGVADAHVAALVNLKNEAHAVMRSIAAAAMTSPKPDAAELESLRQELVNLVDRGSKEILATALETSDVLTDAQRSKIRDHFSWWTDK